MSRTRRAPHAAVPRPVAASWLPPGSRVELVLMPDGSGWRLCAVRGGRLVDGTKPEIVDLVPVGEPRCAWSLNVAHLRLAAVCWAMAIEAAKAEVRARLDALQAQAEDREAEGCERAERIDLLSRRGER